MERQRVLRVDVAYQREGEAAGGDASEELGGGGMPGASRVVRLYCTMAEERRLVNILGVLLPAP
jgi:hypothetical protein